MSKVPRESIEGLQESLRNLRAVQEEYQKTIDQLLARPVLRDALENYQKNVEFIANSFSDPLSHARQVFEEIGRLITVNLQPVHLQIEFNGLDVLGKKFEQLLIELPSPREEVPISIRGEIMDAPESISGRVTTITDDGEEWSITLDGRPNDLRTYIVAQFIVPFLLTIWLHLFIPSLANHMSEKRQEAILDNQEAIAEKLKIIQTQLADSDSTLSEIKANTHLFVAHFISQLNLSLNRKVTVYSKPDHTSETHYAIPSDVTVLLIGEDNWIKVRYSDPDSDVSREGWISSEDLTPPAHIGTNLSQPDS